VNAFVILVLTIHSLVSVGLIVLILLHSGKGTGVSEMFGGIMPSTSSGTSIIEKNLDRITVGFVVTFTVTTLVLMLIYHPGAA
jgi:preprotein translocase subunit SecG